MKIGIYSQGQSVSEITGLLVGRQGAEICWLAGQINSQQDSGHSVNFSDINDALEDNVVDLIVDFSGTLSAAQLGMRIVDAETARMFLAIGGRNLPVRAQGRSEVLESASGQLSENLSKIVSEIEIMTANASKLSDAGAQLEVAAQGILVALEKTSDILASITRIAKRSKIIGLNSAIEAARVGEAGQGFRVVAEEIKNLADDSSRSVKEIEKILSGIRRRSDDFSERILTVQDVSITQMQATRHIAGLLDSLRELSSYLQQLADSVA